MRHLVIATALNVRAEPNAASTVQAVLPRFAVVDEIDTTPDRGWIKVVAPGYRGWVNNGYLIREELIDHPLARIAYQEFGIGEVAGPRSNPRITEYQASIPGASAGDDEVPWCSSFMHWCVKKLKGSVQPHINASARSWDAWGTAVTSAAPPPVGSIAVLWRRDAVADAGKTAEQIRHSGTSGHVSLLVEPFAPGSTSITLLGGNQGNRVSKVTYTLGYDYGVLSFRAV
jgi:uncharacterized protein (TIGR02594 family)